MKAIKITCLALFLISCVPEEQVTDFGRTASPEAGLDAEFITKEDTPILIKYELEDIEEDTDPELVMLEGPKNGVLEGCIDSKRSQLICTYIPNKDYNGEDSMRFMAKAGDFKSDETSLVKIIIEPVADKPIAASQAMSETLPENSTHTFELLPGEDIDSEVLSYVVVKQPDNGQLSNCAEGAGNLNCSYSPNPDYTGNDSFSYKVVDSDGAESLENTTVNFKILNYPELGADKLIEVPEANIVQSFTANQVIDSDSDSSNIKLEIEKAPLHGTLSNCFAVAGSLSCQYQSKPNYSGLDEMEYSAVDADGLKSKKGKITFRVNIKELPVIGANQTVTTKQNTPVTFDVSMATDPDTPDTDLRYSVVDQPANGTLSNCFTIATSRSCTYTPNKTFYMTDSFTYRVQDTDGGYSSAVATVTINVEQAKAPVASPQLVPVNKGAAVTFQVPEATDEDTAPALIKYEVVTQPTYGKLDSCFGAAGVMSCTYQSAPTYIGVDTFTYRAVDELDNASPAATVTLAITESPIGGGGGGVPNNGDVNNIIVKCEEAREKQMTVIRPYNISFAGSSENFTCDFNDNATDVRDATQLNAALNGPRLNEKIRARLEQTSTITLPENATICDMKFKFPEAQQMKYDDEIFLTVNNYVVMASQDVSVNNGRQDFANGLFVNALGLVEYRWLGANSLYDLPYIGGNRLPRYCLGVAANDPAFSDKCNIPPTDQVGTFKLDIPSEEIVKLGITNNDGTISAAKEVQFQFISTGDNDRGDCETSAYSFDIDVEYVQLPEETPEETAPASTDDSGTTETATAPTT